MNVGLITTKYANLTPERPAVVDVPNGRRMNYGELETRACKLANAALGTMALQPGDRVAIFSKNCIEYLEVFYACTRVGLIVQPLNWRLGVPELVKILTDAKPSVFIYSKELSAVAKQLQPLDGVSHWLEFDNTPECSYEKMLRNAPTTLPDTVSDVGDDDPALILYTGGTTGESKGALHSHRSLFAGMLNQTVAERIVATDVYMLTGQMFHIPIGLAINYMSHGCPLVLINFDAKLALQVIEKERVSAFLGITTMLNWMMAVEDFESYDLSSLRNIQYGGGPMPETVVNAALKAFPCTLIQGYGQTEGMTMTFLSQEDHQNVTRGIHTERLMSCGREGYGTEVKVLDSSGEKVPRDKATPGEIFIKSEANMLGYWQKPELTAETIVDGWMATGDIATWDQEGYIYIVDRAKDMIISGGENIYSPQVENAIHQHPAVLEAAVIGIPDDVWGEAVKAVVVLKPGQTATEQDIITTASQHLASYQKPRSVDFVDELPKAPTGKILKRDLRTPYWTNQDRQV